jgi:hypothetical protein
MITLFSLMLLQPTEPYPVPHNHEVNHCYSDDGEFKPRLIKILEVGKREYKFLYKSDIGWFGDFSNTIDTINSVYPIEVECEKK